MATICEDKLGLHIKLDSNEKFIVNNDIITINKLPDKTKVKSSKKQINVAKNNENITRLICHG